MIVMSGSASPITAGQIDWALEHGYAGIRLPTGALLDPATRETTRAAVMAEAEYLILDETSRSGARFVVRLPLPRTAIGETAVVQPNAAWAEALEATMARMDDSLTEC